MTYADYEFYSETYKGNLLSEDTAEVWLTRASDAVNRATRSRITDEMTEFQTLRIKYAVCLTADYLTTLGDSASAGTVASYSIGDVSLSFDDNDKACISKYGIPQRAYEELIQTGLLYTGV